MATNQLDYHIGFDSIPNSTAWGWGCDPNFWSRDWEWVPKPYHIRDSDVSPYKKQRSISPDIDKIER